MDNLLPPRGVCDDAHGPDTRMSKIRHRLAEGLPGFPGWGASSAGRAAAHSQAGRSRRRGTKADAQSVDPGAPDCPIRPAARDPRSFLRAPDPRTCPRLAKPCRGGDACLGCQERQFGQQALWRFEVLGHGRGSHPARPLAASGGQRKGGARFRSERRFPPSIPPLSPPSDAKSAQ